MVNEVLPRRTTVVSTVTVLFLPYHFYKNGLDMIAFVRHLDADYVRPLKWDKSLSGFGRAIAVGASKVRYCSAHLLPRGSQ